jgi:hypothetical protein
MQQFKKWMCPLFPRIHAMKTSEDLKPFHDRLESMFKTMQAQVEEKYGKRRSDITFKRSSNDSVANLVSML